MKISRDEAIRSRDECEKQMGDLKKVNGKSCSENEGLKVEFQRGIEDIAKALGDGYNHCLARMETAGVETTCHSFEQYIQDFSKSIATGNGGDAPPDNEGS